MMTEQLRCELIRSATRLLTSEVAEDRPNAKEGDPELLEMAYNLLVREFRDAEALADLFQNLKGFGEDLVVDKAKLAEEMRNLRSGQLKTLWDVSRGRREANLKDPDVPQSVRASSYGIHPGVAATDREAFYREVRDQVLSGTWRGTTPEQCRKGLHYGSDGKTCNTCGLPLPGGPK